jgi:hypothetical protein
MSLKDKEACIRAIRNSEGPIMPPEMEKEYLSALEKLEEAGFGGVTKKNKDEGDAGPKHPAKRFADAAFHLYVQGLLSSPKTQIVNATSTTIPLLTRIFETATAASLRPFFFNAKEQVHFRTALAEGMGIFEGLNMGLKFLKARSHSLKKTNETVLEELGLPRELMNRRKMDEITHSFEWAESDAGIVKKTANWIEAGVSIPGASLTTMDLFFKIANFRADAAKQAMHHAMNSKATGATRTQIFRAVKDDIVNGNDTSRIMKAVEDAEERTYTRKPKGELARWMVENGGKAPGLRWIVPFRRTLVNLIRFAIDRSPASMAVGDLNGFKTWKNLTGGNYVEIQEAMGRMAFGTSMIIGLNMLLDDRLTGRGPQDPVTAHLWKKDGNKPYTLKTGIPGYENVSLDSFGPYTFFLKAHADFTQYMSNVDYEDPEEAEQAEHVMQNYMLRVFDSLMSEHWLTGLSEAAENFMYIIDQESGEKALNRIGKTAGKEAFSFVPLSNFWRTMATKPIDPHIKEINNGWEAFLAQMPVYSKQVENKIDFWGDPMTYQHWFDLDFADPIPVETPISREMKAVGVTIPKIRHIQKGVQLTPDEYRAIHVLRGKGVPGMPPIADALADLMSNDFYRDRQYKTGRATLIENLIAEYKANAVEYLYLNDSNFQQRVDAAEALKLELSK